MKRAAIAVTAAAALPDYGVKDPSIDYGDTDDPYDNQAFGSSAYDDLANLLGGMEHTPEDQRAEIIRDWDHSPPARPGMR